MERILTLIQLAGVVSLLSAFERLWRVLQMRRRGVRTMGTVIEHVPEKGPWILFQDQLGNRHCFTPDFSPSWERAHGAPAGTHVEIAYLPEEPKKVRLLSDTAPIDTDRTFDGRALRYIYFTIVSPPFLKGRTMRKEDLLRQELRNRGVRTVGTVVTHIPRSLGRGYNSGMLPAAHYPRIQFKEQRGETVTSVHRWAHIGLKPRGIPAVGERVPVIYLPESPHLAWMTGIARKLEDLALRFFVGLLIILLVQFIK